MEVSFSKEVQSLRLGAGETFHGEGILAITKALLQSGVAYVGGYQGAPVSHLLDVMVQAEPYLDELGVHVEACANEASAAAMLGASIHYPLRGAVTWKSIVGTNVAADALSNLSSPGVMGGALIVVGEDYGEGASVIQERTHAFALKSSMLAARSAARARHMVRMVEHGVRAVGGVEHAGDAGAAHPRLPRARQLRLQGQLAPAVSTAQPMAEPAAFDYARLAHPPVTFAPGEAARSTSASRRRALHRRARLNELFDGRHDERRHRRAGRPLQLAGARAAAARPGRRVRRERDPDARAERHLPAGARGDRALLRRQARGARRRGRPARVHRAGHRYATLRRARRADAAARQGPAAGGRRVHGRGAGARARELRRAAPAAASTSQPARAWLAANAQRRERGRGRAARHAAAGAPADLLHRLPRAAGVRGAEAGAAGRRPGRTSRPTSAAMRSRPSSRSRRATRSSATA